ncbi:hypothetical protein [Azospirillum argentinense]|uniref:Uncharacterized protein n=1 Tax=Azospirillum argentinense TaxID=2970906 RepID=A0A5B0KLZ3_9PROT|nr:hypothetical protein [Azospirillum argentinense]KAA1053239.1 hypothetical protein FH063_003158 [Azospirillum argentinense]
MKTGYSLRTWRNLFRADGLPTLEACTAVYAVLWHLDEFEDEDWFVIKPDGDVLTELNFPFEHDDGEVYCSAEDVEWISEEERITIAAQIGNGAPPLPPHVEFRDREGL